MAASAALTISGAPFKGPIGAARVGFSNDEYILNPTLDEMVETQLDLVVAGTADAVWRQAGLIRDLAPDVLLVVSADAVYRLDYDELVTEHLGSGAAVTMVTTSTASSTAAARIGGTASVNGVPPRK